MELISFISKVGMNEHYPEMGTVFMQDILNWQQSFQKSVIKDINRCSTKVYLHKGWVWEKEKRRLNRTLDEKAILRIVQKKNVNSYKEKELIHSFYGLVDSIGENKRNCFDDADE